MTINNLEYSRISIINDNAEVVATITDNETMETNGFHVVLEFDADPNNPDTYQKYLG